MRTQERFKSWIPRGFDFLNSHETELLLALSEKARTEFKKQGFAEIIPPMIDYASTFLLTTRSHLPDRIFEMRDGDGEYLSLRSDLTVQVIKAAAAGRITQNPQKYCYIQPVMQDHHSGAGYSREIVQAGIEWIAYDANDRFQTMLSLADSVLEAMGFSGHFIVGDARFVEKLMELTPEHCRKEISEAFHIKDTATIEKICQREIQTGNMTEQTGQILCEVPMLIGKQDTVGRLKEICKPYKEIVNIIDDTAAFPDVVYDFSLVRELSYYTGPVFEGYIKDSTDPVITGGIYDDLFERFSKESKAACGFAINLSVLNTVSRNKEGIL